MKILKINHLSIIMYALILNKHLKAVSSFILLIYQSYLSQLQQKDFILKYVLLFFMSSTLHPQSHQLQVQHHHKLLNQLQPILKN